MDLLIDLISLYLGFVIFVEHFDEFVDLFVIQTNVEFAEGFLRGSGHQNFRKGAVEGVDEEKELVSVDSCCVLKTKNVDHCLEIGLIGALG